jgi:hypothetical protein
VQAMGATSHTGPPYELVSVDARPLAWIRGSLTAGVGFLADAYDLFVINVGVYSSLVFSVSSVLNQPIPSFLITFSPCRAL